MIRLSLTKNPVPELAFPVAEFDTAAAAKASFIPMLKEYAAKVTAAGGPEKMVYRAGTEQAPETIEHVAVMKNGKVWTGLNHADAYENMLNKEKPFATGAATARFNEPRELYRGFLTSTGRFVDKYDAHAIARGEPPPSETQKQWSPAMHGYELTGVMGEESLEDVAHRRGGAY
jgi:hypothetical protein